MSFWGFFILGVGLFFLLLPLLFVFFVLFAGRDNRLGFEWLPQAFKNATESTSRRDDEKTLKILTYNIGYASGDKNNQGCVLSLKEVEQNLDSIAAAIQKSQADVVFLQEVDFWSRRTFYQNQLEWLQNRLNFSASAYAQTWNRRYLPWPWPPKKFFGPIISGQAVLGHFPILRQELHLFPKPGSKSFLYNHFYLERLAQEIEIQVGDKKITLWNIHLEAFDAATRTQHFEILAEIIQKNPSDYKIAAGDFNLATGDQAWILPESREILKRFEENSGLKRVNAGTEELVTFPSWGPQGALDYVFMSEGFELEQVEVFKEFLGSDHLALIAQLRII